MAATATKTTSVLKNAETATFHLNFTSTTATVEVATGFSVVYGAFAIRVGDANADNAGTLTIDESITSNAVAESTITVDRMPLTNSGTLAAEDFLLVVFGKS